MGNPVEDARPDERLREDALLGEVLNLLSTERSASFAHSHSLPCFSTSSAIQHLPDIPSKSSTFDLSNDVSNISRIAKAVEPLSVEKHTPNEKNIIFNGQQRNEFGDS